MKNFHIKSIILGIGIGMVLTAIISMVYLAGQDPTKDLSREEIIELAKQYGMIESPGIIDNSDKIDNSEEKESGKFGADTTDVTSNQAGSIQSSAKPEVKKKERTVVIKTGDASEVVAKKLLQAGLIADKDSFLEKLIDKGLEGKIRVGSFKIKLPASQDDIIKKITR